jgi:hypothetical protein
MQMPGRGARVFCVSFGIDVFSLDVFGAEVVRGFDAPSLLDGERAAEQEHISELERFRFCRSALHVEVIRLGECELERQAVGVCAGC